MSGLKKLLFRLLFLSIVLVIIITSEGSSTVHAAPLADQPTITEVFPNKVEIHTLDAVNFTVHVTSDGDSVPNGLVTIQEVTDYSYYVSGEIINGIVILEWVAQPWTPTGWCTFIATYEGTVGYTSSSGTTEVNVDDPVSTGQWGTETSITPDISTASPSSNVTFTVSITILGGAFPVFSGGYITLIDTSENIVLDKKDIVTQAAVTYITDFTLNIPSWYSSGIHMIEARYTGSLEVDHAPSTGSCSLQILINGYSLSLRANTTIFDREDSNLLLDAYIQGDDPTTHLLTLEAIQNTTHTLLDELTVTSRDYSFLFIPDYSYQLGTIEFELTLRSPLTGGIEVQERLSVIIVDTTAIIYEFDAEEYSVGDTIHLTVYTVENDIPTQAVQANVSIRDLTIPLELDPVTTNIWGRTEFTWIIPEEMTGGLHQIEIQAIPLELCYLETTISTQITVRGDIEFILAYPTSVQLGTSTTINCTVLSGSDFIREGILNLRHQNGSLIWSTELTGPIQYTYTVPLTHELGSLGLLWEYEGSEVYRSGSQSFAMTVFSQPYFDSLIPNRTSVIREQTVKIDGRLLDETGQGVGYVDVTVWDNDQLIDTISTVENGSFVYEYVIPSDTSMGLHVIETHFIGDYTQFRLPASNFGVCTFTVRPPLQVSLNNPIIGGDVVIIQVSGASYEEIELAWSPLNDSPLPWYIITSLTLDSKGQGNWPWSVPIFKGNISVRAVNLVGEMVFTQVTVYVRAEVILLNWWNETEVQTILPFEGQVSEEFRLLLDEKVISTWQTAGFFQQFLSFQTRGPHTFTIETRGTYVLAENHSYTITGIETLTATLSLPSSVSASEGVTAEVTVEGIHEGPVSGLTVYLYANDTERAVATTTAEGKATLTFSISPGSYNITCKTQGQTAYYTDTQTSQSLLVRSTTQLTLFHTELHYYEECTISAKLQDELGDAVTQHLVEFLLSTDQGNTWTSLGVNSTDNNGTSQINWFNEIIPGTYLFKASYVGSFYYDAVLTTVEVEVYKNDIIVTWPLLSGEYGSDVLLNASLTNPTGIAISDSLNFSLSIFYQDQWNLIVTGISNAKGFVPFLFKLDFLPGTYTIRITFDGNMYHQSEMWQGVLQVVQKETLISLDQPIFETTYGTLQNITISVTSSTGTPLQGIEVLFSVQKDQITYLDLINSTDNKGKVSFKLPITLPQGVYRLSFECSGNQIYAISSTDVELIVSKGTGYLESIMESSTIEYGANIIWHAYVTDISRNSVANVPITFATSLTGIFWDIWGTIETNTSGCATLEITWLHEVQMHYGTPGTYTLKVYIEDNPYIISQQETRIISVTKMGVVLTLENCTITRSSKAIIQGFLTSSTADAITNAPILVSWNGTETGEWEELITVSTAENGSFYAETNLTQPPSTYGIKAEYFGDNYHDTGSSISILTLEPGAIKKPLVLVSPSNIGLGEVISIEISEIDPILIPNIKLFLITTSFHHEQIINVSKAPFIISIPLDETFPLASYSVSVQLQLNNGTWKNYEDLANFVIFTNSAPILTVNWDRLSLADGESVNYNIFASDSLGISKISIIRQNETIPIELSINGIALGELCFSAPGTHWVQVQAIDKAEAKTTANFTFNVNGKGPEFISIFPSSNILSELHSPLLLEVETIVTDPSGINSVVLHVNSTDYPLTYANGVWRTSLDLPNGTYSLWLTATDVYNIRSNYELGQITPRLSETTFPITENLNSETDTSINKNDS
ncbi:MAG: Ig-like domain-containing protein, partial [Candidatus Hodarchaeota archaeon]